SRIAIFNSDVMTKKKSIVVVSFTGAALVRRSARRHALGSHAPVRELRCVLPEFRSLVRLLRSHQVPSAAVLLFSRSARRYRRSYGDLSRRIVGLFRLFGEKHLRSNEASHHRRPLEGSRVKPPNHREHSQGGEWRGLAVASDPCR